MQNLTQLPNWSPSNKLYYGKFHSQITVGPTAYEAVDVSKFDNISYRRIQNYIFSDALLAYEVFTTVYTSNADLIQHLLDNYQLVSILTPANDNHQQLIENVHTHTVLRETLYYRKYQFRVVVWCNHRAQVSALDFAEINSRVKEVFCGDSRLLGTRWGDTYSTYIMYEIQHIPTIFTNDEAGIMMLKLSYGDKFRFQITKAYVLNDLI